MLSSLKLLAALPLAAVLAQGGVLPRASKATTTSTASGAATSSSSGQTTFSTTSVGQEAFVNKGLVGFGRISGDAYDSYGESLGGLGSAISVESFRKAGKNQNTYSGTIRMQPDRGHNQGGAATSDYRARSQVFSFTFSPLADNAAATGNAANLQFKYESSTLYRLSSNYTTGLNPDAVRTRSGKEPLPLATYDYHTSFDTEGLVDIGDILISSDEYGPYIYAIEKSSGTVVGVLTPPDAIIPMINGSPNFTANSDPTTGRVANQGFEGLSVSTSKGVLYALLQSGTVQDGGSSDTSSPYTRLLGYSYAGQSLAQIAANGFEPKLVEEYVVKLPTSNKGKARGASELHVVGDGIFAVLARDGKGLGNDPPTDASSYKEVGLLTTAGATNIAGTKYDSPENPVAPGGQLVDGITAATVQDWLSLIDTAQLAKFGIHNGGTLDQNLIASKLESLALASVGDSAYPDDYFLFVVSDNDFITLNGKQAGQAQGGSGPYVLQDYQDPYAVEYKLTQDTQAYVYRVTLPGYKEQTPN
ncbi:hypothetical protein BCV69DRAFT_279842 [Microstroma glucosiphilum]|uniref:Phytase-like domain-containing protein n=1 Tax=Pseudomicrostroma glucosiphilum TaxID=1684307 RepID=A0A316UFB4_9BASI|nr:hypothetical protein BCV69DRAFT_279842 [Pseudomicrostroma glucosiphilum]PWN23939.1 hypothetical protein BCV69DRAFT_279842 [Pseudomicrostroma glucosiphilum]